MPPFTPFIPYVLDVCKKIQMMELATESVWSAEDGHLGAALYEGGPGPQDVWWLVQGKNNCTMKRFATTIACTKEDWVMDRPRVDIKGKLRWDLWPVHHLSIGLGDLYLDTVNWPLRSLRRHKTCRGVPDTVWLRSGQRIALNTAAIFRRHGTLSGEMGSS
jgi:hypothetical protein